VPSFCLPWHIVDGEIAKMTDEERRIALCDKLHRKGFIVAGEEIMKMQRQIERLAKENQELKSALDYAWRRIEAETGAKE
jgi:hypothetical protein